MPDSVLQGTEEVIIDNFISEVLRFSEIHKDMDLEELLHYAQQNYTKYY